MLFERDRVEDLEDYITQVKAKPNELQYVYRGLL